MSSAFAGCSIAQSDQEAALRKGKEWNERQRRSGLELMEVALRISVFYDADDYLDKFELCSLYENPSLSRVLRTAIWSAGIRTVLSCNATDCSEQMMCTCREQ